MNAVKKQKATRLAHHLLPSSEVSPYCCLNVRPACAVKGGTVVADTSMHCSDNVAKRIGILRRESSVDVLLLAVGI